MAVIMFKPQFVPLVENGSKRQTIRPPRKRPIKVGDKLSLRCWEGVAYRSATRTIKETKCTATASIRIYRTPAGTLACTYAANRLAGDCCGLDGERDADQMAHVGVDDASSSKLALTFHQDFTEAWKIILPIAFGLDGHLAGGRIDTGRGLEPLNCDRIASASCGHRLNPGGVLPEGKGGGEFGVDHFRRPDRFEHRGVANPVGPEQRWATGSNLVSR